MSVHATPGRDLAPPIPHTYNEAFTCRRARLIRGLTQELFADEMGVDPATVSRWERGQMNPSPPLLVRMRRITTRAEPSYSDPYISQSPTIKMVSRMDDLLTPMIVSSGLLSAIDLTLEEVLSVPREFWAEGAHRVNNTLQNDERWQRGEIAFFEAVHQGKPELVGEDMWVHSIGAPLTEAHAVLWEAILMPGPDYFRISLTPFETH